MKVTQAGSDAQNHGIISACGNGYGLAYISASFNQTLMAIYSTAANREGFLRDWYGSVNISQKVGGEREADLKLWVRSPSSMNAFDVKRFIGINSTGTGYFSHSFDPPLYIDPESDIYVSACAQDANTDVAAGFDIYLRDIT